MTAVTKPTAPFRLLRLALTLCLLGALSAGAALAQGTSASVQGTVADEAGAPLPGVNVVAVHQPTGTQYGAATNANGRYTILNMRVGGPYTIEASFVGYRTARESGFSLTLDQTRVVDFELAEATAELEGVEVTGERSSVLNSERTGARTNVSEEQIERNPTIERSLADFARLTPQSTGGSSLAGRNNRYNNIQIDGATLNDVFGLSGTGAPGGQAGAEPISLDAIQEFNVDIAPFDIRNSGFTGGQINAITRSGTNQFEGSVYTLGRNQDFVGTLQNAAGEDLEFADFSEYTAGFRLGGPLIENKLFFFVNGEIERRNDPLSVGIAGSNASEIFDVPASTFNEVIDIAQNQYGYDPGSFGPLTQDQDDNKFLAKLDWNISANHRLTLRHNYVDASQGSGLGRGDENFSLSGQQYTFRSTQNSTVAELRSTLGANLFNEGRLVYTRIRDRRDLGDATPFPNVQLNTTGDFNNPLNINFGIERFSQANSLDQDIVEFTDNLTYVLGNHSLTVGTSNQFFRFNNLFIQDLFGNYEFDTVEDFRSGTPTLYSYSYSLLEGDRRPSAEFNAFQLGLYAQDEWTVLPNMRLTLGVRVDVPFAPEEPLNNTNVPGAFPQFEEQFGTLSTTNTATGNPLFAPRLGFNYSRGETLTTQVRGGTGIFTGRTPFVWISNQYTNTGVDVARIDLATFRGQDVPMFEPDPSDQPTAEDLGAATQTAEINLIDEDFKFPQVWRTNLAVDQGLPYGFVATLEGIYSNTVNGVLYKNANIVQTGTAFDGRPLYGTFDNSFASVQRASSDFTNALFLTNTSEGYEYSLTAQLQKTTSVGLSGSLSYTYNRAENVNNLTSSRAISNWQFNENLDANNPRLGTADFERRHRFLANVSYRLEYADRFATTLAVVYDGASGSPFSWIYAGDVNADDERFNDLAYVPVSEDEVVLEPFPDNPDTPEIEDPRTPGEIWNQLDTFIESEEALREARGRVIERNAARTPWENRLDLRLNQELFTFQGQRVELTANLFNALNLLNSEWGQVQFTQFDNANLLSFNGYVTEADIGTERGGRTITPGDVGKIRVSFDEGDFQNEEGAFDRDQIFQTSDLASRWQLQLGLRYTF